MLGPVGPAGRDCHWAIDCRAARRIGRPGTFSTSHSAHTLNLYHPTGIRTHGLLSSTVCRGRPGLAWRTRHATGHAAHAAHDARREAVLRSSLAANKATAVAGKKAGRKARKQLEKRAKALVSH